LLAALNRCRLALFRRFFENLLVDSIAFRNIPDPSYFFFYSHPQLTLGLKVGPQLLEFPLTIILFLNLYFVARA
jgi:hypothetical protein